MCWNICRHRNTRITCHQSVVFQLFRSRNCSFIRICASSLSPLASFYTTVLHCGTAPFSYFNFQTFSELLLARQTRDVISVQLFIWCRRYNICARWEGSRTTRKSCLEALHAVNCYFVKCFFTGCLL